MMLADKTNSRFHMYEDYIYHTLVAKASGELCLNYTFSLGAFARKPLLQRLAHLCVFLVCTNFPVYPSYVLTTCTLNMILIKFKITYSLNSHQQLRV